MSLEGVLHPHCLIPLSLPPSLCPIVPCGAHLLPDTIQCSPSAVLTWLHPWGLQALIFSIYSFIKCLGQSIYASVYPYLISSKLVWPNSTCINPARFFQASAISSLFTWQTFMCDLWLLLSVLVLLCRCFAAKLSSLCLISYTTVAPWGRSCLLRLGEPY